ncbi:ATPases of the AAA class [Balamuthia mandrillaris]
MEESHKGWFAVGVRVEDKYGWEARMQRRLKKKKQQQQQKPRSANNSPFRAASSSYFSHSSPSREGSHSPSLKQFAYGSGSALEDAGVRAVGEAYQPVALLPEALALQHGPVRSHHDFLLLQQEAEGQEETLLVPLQVSPSAFASSSPRDTSSEGEKVTLLQPTKEDLSPPLRASSSSTSSSSSFFFCSAENDTNTKHTRIRARAKVIPGKRVLRDGELVSLPFGGNERGMFRCSCYRLRGEEENELLRKWGAVTEDTTVTFRSVEEDSFRQRAAEDVGLVSLRPYCKPENGHEEEGEGDDLLPGQEKQKHERDEAEEEERDDENGLDSQPGHEKRKNESSDDDLNKVEEEDNEAREMLRVIIWYSLVQPSLAKQWGLQQSRGVLLHGPPATGKTTMVHGLAVEADAEVISVSAGTLSLTFPGQPKGTALRHYFELARRLQPSILLVDDADIIFPRMDAADAEEEASSHEATSVFLSLAEELASSNSLVLLVVVTSRLKQLHPRVRNYFEDEIEVDIPTPMQRRTIFRGCMRRYCSSSTAGVPVSLSQNLSLHTISDRCHGFTGGDVIAVCRDAVLNAVQRYWENGKKATVEESDFAIVLQRHRPSTLGKLAVSVPRVSWNDVGGMHEAKEQLQEAVTWAYERRDAYFRLGIYPPTGILLYGPPGTGKTLLCSAVASECHANFLPVNIVDLVQSYVGESEKMLAEIFRKAKSSSPCILFFDEIQAIFGSRSSGGSSTKMMISQLLLEMDMMNSESHDRKAKGREQYAAADARVIVIAATNCPEAIDESFLRPGRFERCIYVGPPDASSRANILSLFFGGSGERVCPGVLHNLTSMVERTEGFTGADLQNVCRKAALLALQRDHQKIEWEDVDEALQESTPSVTPEVVASLLRWRERNEA